MESTWGHRPTSPSSTPTSAPATTASRSGLATLTWPCRVSGVRCGPGYGISGGSLGKGADKGDVIGLTVKNCTITQTMNGIRIKTWQSKPEAGGTASMRVSNFRFEDILMNNVSNPIIIDQEYCPYHSCPELDAIVVDRFYGVGNAIDQHQDTRMDTNGMSYVELLALGEQIGFVKTGLTEEYILNHLKTSICSSQTKSRFSQETETCIICQVENATVLLLLAEIYKKSDPSFSNPFSVLNPLNQAVEALEILEYHEMASEAYYLMAMIHSSLGLLEEREEVTASFQKHVIAFETPLI